MIRPTEIIEELDKLRQLMRQRPKMTVSVSVFVVLLVIGGLWLTFPNLTPLDPSKNRLTIRKPVVGELVDEVEPIVGFSGGGPALMYPLVTPLQTGLPYIAGPAVDVRTDGTWSGHARFGDVNTPPGSKFQLQILRSAVPLAEGALRKAGNAPALSESVTVERR